MIKYEVFMYDDYETGNIIYTDTSKSSLCKKLHLDDPYKIDVYVNEDVIYIDYNGKPYCELHKID